MSDLQHRLAELRALTPAPLDDARIDSTIARAKRRRVRRVQASAATLTLLTIMAAGTGWYRLRGRPTMTFADGSTADLLDDKTELHVTDSSTARVEVEVAKGRSRFDVVHDEQRAFRVIAGPVTVEVIGTRFIVEHDPKEVHVLVERGRVRVRTAEGEHYLSAGEDQRIVLRTPVAPLVAPPIEPPVAEAPEAETETPTPMPPSHPNWRASAERGNYAVAYSQIHAGGSRVVRDAPEELMLAADVARWSHHSAAAVPLLDRVVRDHHRDPRAQLAAFTLGRVYLEELGKPREAALAFARAYAFGARGPLAEDALAHEVEAWSRADELARAHERAQLYQRTYPSGPHRNAVRRFGRIE